MRVITYHAYAMHEGRLRGLTVTRGTDRKQEWTDDYYRTAREADADCERRNCGGAR